MRAHTHLLDLPLVHILEMLDQKSRARMAATCTAARAACASPSLWQCVSFAGDDEFLDRDDAEDVVRGLCERAGKHLRLVDVSCTRNRGQPVYFSNLVRDIAPTESRIRVEFARWSDAICVPGRIDAVHLDAPCVQTAAAAVDACRFSDTLLVQNLFEQRHRIPELTLAVGAQSTNAQRLLVRVSGIFELNMTLYGEHTGALFALFRDVSITFSTRVILLAANDNGVEEEQNVIFPYADQLINKSGQIIASGHFFRLSSVEPETGYSIFTSSK